MKKWTKKEVDFLKKNYLKLTYNEMASHLKRKRKVVGWKLNHLGLKKSKIVTHSSILKKYYQNNPHYMKGVPKPEEQKSKISESRKKYLKKTDSKILNEIYKKMANTKRRKEVHLGENNPMYGKKRPDLSKRNREQWNDVNFRRKMRKVLAKNIEKMRNSTTLRNRTNNPMWNPETVKKAVRSRDYKEIARKTTLTKRKKGIFLEYSKRMKENNPMKDPLVNAKVNKNPEYMKKRISSLIKKPNHKEKVLIDLIDKNKLPYNYVGNGKLMIGSKNPDFIHKTNNNIIELFGDYWHSNKKARCYEETEEGRIKFFKEYGFNTLVIWEKELKNPNLILKKIRLFSRTPIVLYS